MPSHTINNAYETIPAETYKKTLFQCMGELPNKEVEFFINPKRFELLQKQFPSNSLSRLRSILDVACGPFSFEQYVPLADDCKIEAFDLSPLIECVHGKLKSAGYHQNISFNKMGIDGFETDKKFDLVLINDLFYLKQLDFFEHVERYSKFVNEDGFIYFDLLDQKNAWAWRLFGKDERFARYSLREVFLQMRELGFKPVNHTPSLGIKGGFDGVLRNILLKMTGATNNHVFLFQKIK